MAFFDFLKLAKPQNHPVFWQEYLSLFENTRQKNLSVKDVRFVVFDTETTGLDARKDKIIQIGAVQVENYTLALSNSLEILVQQKGIGSNSELAVHGIRQAALQRGIPEKDAVKTFVQYIGNSILVGQHVLFDVAMINQVLKNQWGVKLKNACLDTVALAQRIEKPPVYSLHNPAEFTLDALCNRYQVPMHDRHTAPGDAYITAVLFMKLLARLEKKGVRQLKQLI